MPTLTNFPGGVSSFGIPVLPGGMFFDKVLWVNSAYGAAGNPGTPSAPLASVFGANGAWAKAVSGASTNGLSAGTLVICMKGSTETISAADFGSDLGTNKRVYVVGQGDEVERPTWTWTVAGSTLLLDTTSLVLDNLNLNLEPGTGTINVAAPLTLSAAGCGLRRCKIRGGTDANNLVTVGITISAADCFLEQVTYYAATAAEATTHLRLTAADRLRVRDLYLFAATSAVGVGSVQFLTTASVQIDWQDFAIANNKAASTAAVSGMAAVSGFVRKGQLHVLNNNATDLTSAWGTKASVQFNAVGVTNDVGEVTTSLLPLSA